MSNVTQVDNIIQIVQLLEPTFSQLAAIHGAVTYKAEAAFAMQAMTDNSFLMKTAIGNPDSLKRAIVNVAAVGISLNPVTKFAYLVPRDGKVCLDISYRGYIQMAVDAGAIKWALAEIVCEKDEYVFEGHDQKPIHRFNPFADRGEPIGAYCLAKTHDGDFILTQMSAEEIMSIRDRSPSWKSHKKDGTSTPWATDRNELIKKTVIKRASKSWQRADSRERIERAVDVMNEADQIDFSAPAIEAPKQDEREKLISQIHMALKVLDRTEAAFLVHLSRVTRHEIKTLNDLTPQEMGQAIVMLNQWVETKKQKDGSRESAS